MSREDLRNREIAPGDVRDFEISERFSEAAMLMLDPAEYEVVDHPADLADIYSDDYGVVPEAMIRSYRTGRLVFIEVKRQGPTGNAEERAYKHYAPGFIDLLHERYGMPYHPFVTVFCDSLATEPRYTTKIAASLAYPHYFFWEGYRIDLLADYLDVLRAEFLDD